MVGRRRNGASDGRAAARLRRRFLVAFWRELRIVWPILSGLIGIQLALGAVVGYVEQWPLADAAYFTFVTGLTIGYGDLVPLRLATRLIALVIGLIGILLTGLIAALGVRALQVTVSSPVGRRQDTGG